MKKWFVFTGPESSGKTTLAERLSADLNLPLVPEFARQYLENKGGKYTLEEIDYIAQKQRELESEAHRQ
ncbi:MAG: ATP-binding protein [Saprospiraceae bacterium]|nr:ATP-binding protein [Saprospiraceae bacterium]